MLDLTSTLKKGGGEAHTGNDLSNILPKSSHTRKKPPPLPEVAEARLLFKTLS